jgi:NADPH-dependent 2,4-dienoyl-CoA reductase/sulfur reductase-like enzyme/rhodanese-related sulfurtransferase
MESDKMTGPNPRIVIVGGVAAGASAAARARRISEEAEIVLIERGPYISFANCGLPYHIGGTIQDRAKLLVQTPDSMRSRFRIDVRTHTEAVRIDRAARCVHTRDVETGAEAIVPYGALILCPGAEPVRPPLPGIDDPRVRTLRNIEDMDAILRLAESDRTGRAVVVGGGYIGLEMAENLSARGLAVTIVEMLPQVMGPADPEMAEYLHRELESHGIELLLGVSVRSFTDAEQSLEIVLSSGETLACGLAILSVGVRPDVRLAREAGLEIGSSGGITVDVHMRTSDPAIFAAGDAVEVLDFVTGRSAAIPLAGPANRQGRIAADNALGRSSAYRTTQGTAICKVFDLAIAMTGASEKVLLRAGSRYEKIYVHPASHAGYYPGGEPIAMKMLFDPETGKILGAQAVGKDGVDKRIDVLAVAIRAGLTVFDLEEMELCYAPPYGSAKDPVNYTGFVAANVMRGDVALCHVEALLDPKPGQALLDVRNADELAKLSIQGAKHIRLDDLRDRLGELDREKEYLVFCAVGLRGYLACRILTQRGFRCRNLSGGIQTFDVVRTAQARVQANTRL